MRINISEYSPVYSFRFKKEDMPFDDDFYLNTLCDDVLWNYSIVDNIRYYNVIVFNESRRRVAEIMNALNGYHLRQLDTKTVMIILKVLCIDA